MMPAFWEEPISCAEGFAFGLQFSSQKPGTCYIAVSNALNTLQGIQDLLMYIYIPSTWPDIMTASSNVNSYIASIISNCNI